MKNLASCKPSEFLAQTNRIRKTVEKWLNDTDILNIRKTKIVFNKEDTAADKDAAIKRQIRENVDKMLDAMLEEHADETLELLALMCFVEPENVDDHSVSEYLLSLYELLNDTAVINFFTSLVKLGQTNISRA